MISYFVRIQGREQLLGTLAADGTLTRNPELQTADADADGDGAALSKALSVRLDPDGRPLSSTAPAQAHDTTVDRGDYELLP